MLSTVDVSIGSSTTTVPYDTFGGSSIGSGFICSKGYNMDGFFAMLTHAGISWIK
jgi:hypothetical protein